MQVIGDEVGAEGLALAGRGLRDTTRLASSPAGVWRDILETNRDNLAPAVAAVTDALRRLLDDPDELARTFEAAGDWKRRLDAQFTEPA
jgi:prephenate dehydrogenase